MTTLQDLIRMACEDSGEVDFRNSYSGRGMYGRQCVGIDGDSHTLRQVIAAVIKDMSRAVASEECDEEVRMKMNEDFDRDVDILMNYSEDSMGMGRIYYWPELESIEEVEQEHDGQPDEAQEWHDFDPDC